MIQKKRQMSDVHERQVRVYDQEDEQNNDDYGAQTRN